MLSLFSFWCFGGIAKTRLFTTRTGSEERVSEFRAQAQAGAAHTLAAEAEAGEGGARFPAGGGFAEAECGVSGVSAGATAARSGLEGVPLKCRSPGRSCHSGVVVSSVCVWFKASLQ